MFKVLLIDDEESILKIIKTVLTKEGYEVDTAKSKSEALTKLNTNSYNLILSDYLLEDGTGIEILEDFRKKDSITPFIIITAYGSINGAVEAVKKRCQPLHTKTHRYRQPYKAYPVLQRETIKPF